MAQLPADKLLKLAATNFPKFEKEIEKAAPKVVAAVDAEMRRLLGKPYIPGKAPPPSKPQPKLTREPAPAPKPEPKTQTQTKPVPVGTGTGEKSKRKWEDDRDAGLVKISDAVAIVRKISEGEGAWKEFIKDLGIPDLRVPLTKAGGSEPTIRETIAADRAAFRAMSKPDQMIELIRRSRLFPKNPRHREKLKTPGRYPNGTKEADIMRRGESFKVKRKLITLVGPYGGMLRLMAVDEADALKKAMKIADDDIAKQRKKLEAEREARAKAYLYG